MLEILKPLRPVNCAMTSVAVLIGAVLSGVYSVNILYAMASAFLVCGGGMLINDWFDWKADRINKKKVYKKRNNLLMLSSALFAAGMALSYFINAICFLIALFNSFLLIFYSPKIKKIPLVKNLSISYLVASGFLFGGAAVGSVIIPLWLSLLAFSSNIGREIAKDIEDMKGDKALKIKTLPIIAGKEFASGISILFVFFAIAMSPVPYLAGLLNEKYLIGVIVADVVFAVSCFFILISPEKAQKIMKIAMLIVLIAFLAGIFL